MNIWSCDHLALQETEAQKGRARIKSCAVKKKKVEVFSPRSSCRLTSFLDLLPAELVPPDHREDRIKALQRDHLQGLLQMERMEARGRSLNVAYHTHLCKKHSQQKMWQDGDLSLIKQTRSGN